MERPKPPVTDVVRMRIESTKHHGYQAKVFINGEQFFHCESLMVDIDSKGPVRAQLNCLFPEVMVDGTFKREVWYLEAVEDDGNQDHAQETSTDVREEPPVD